MFGAGNSFTGGADYGKLEDMQEQSIYVSINGSEDLPTAITCQKVS